MHRLGNIAAPDFRVDGVKAGEHRRAIPFAVDDVSRKRDNGIAEGADVAGSGGLELLDHVGWKRRG